MIAGETFAFSLLFLLQTCWGKKGVILLFFVSFFFFFLKSVLPAVLLVLYYYYLGDGCDMLIIYGSEKIDFPQQKCFQFSLGHNFMSTTK